MNRSEYDEHWVIRPVPKDIHNELMEFPTLIHSLFLKAHGVKFESHFPSVDTFVVLEK